MSPRVSVVVTPTPHDALVRAIFGQPQYAAQEMLTALPPRMLGALRIETLAPVEGSFIDEELRASSADLLFSVCLRRGDSNFAYVLLEHQSTPDVRIPFRLLRYQARIWERHAARHPEDQKLPPIVPLLLHHGSKPWPWEPTFASGLLLDEFERADFGENLVAFNFVLDDLARQTDAQILARASDAVVRLTLLALRNGRSHPRLYELMAEAIRHLRDELRGAAVVPSLNRLARYALELGETPLDVVQAAFARSLEPEDRSSIMVSTADQLRAEALREALLDQLEVKFGTIDAATRDRVERGSLEQLKAWHHRVVVVAAIDELFES